MCVVPISSQKPVLEELFKEANKTAVGVSPTVNVFVLLMHNVNALMFDRSLMFLHLSPPGLLLHRLKREATLLRASNAS